MKTSILKNIRVAFAITLVLIFSGMSFALSGSGTESSPYLIGTASDLKEFAKKVNGGEKDAWAKLTADIRLNAKVLNSDGTLYNNGSGLEQWTPIGTTKNPFTGSFDGDGYTISGLYFNNESKDSVGLFGVVDVYGKVMNVGVEDSYIKGRSYVGGVVGDNYGTVSDVYNTGSVNGSFSVGGVVGDNSGSVNNAYNTGSVNGSFSVGGVVGDNSGSVNNAYNTGSVQGADEVGGVVGSCYGTNGSVSAVYNTGAVSGGSAVGGVIGSSTKSVGDVYNTGVVSGTGKSVGSVIGNNSKNVSISNSYFNVEIDCSQCDNSLGIGLTAWELATTTLSELFTPTDNWLAGSVKSVQSDGKTIVYLPGLKNVGFQPEMECDGMKPNSDGVYEISSAQELEWFAEFINVANAFANAFANAKLTTNIVLNKNVLNADGSLSKDYATFTQWTPIGTSEKPFRGTFDGNGYKISGLYFNNENKDFVGLFGDVYGKVMNVGVEDSYIRGRNYVGGVVGYNLGTVSDVYNTGSVSGDAYVGGVVGCNYKGAVSNVYNIGSVSGSSSVGGVVGYKNSGTVSNAYYNVNTPCTKCSDSYGTGTTTWELATTLPYGFSESIWVAGSVKSDLGNGKVVVLLPGLKNAGSRPEMECDGMKPNSDGVYEISSVQQFKLFAEFVNRGHTSIMGKLTANIRLNAGKTVLNSDGTLHNSGSGLEQWTPIGTTKKPFEGTFDGDGHTISGLYFNNENENYVGLFGYVGSNGKVMNFGVEDSYIRGRDDVGGIVGGNYGTVSDVYNTGSVSGTSINVGGVVGYNYRIVSNVYNTGSVSGRGDVGGVVGDNSGSVNNAYNTGSVQGADEVGGVVGDNSGSVNNAYNTGSVSGTSNYVGGVVGYNSYGSVNNAYYNTDFFTGNALGFGSSGENVKGLKTVDLASATLPTGFSSEIWAAGFDKPVISNGKILYKLVYLKDVGSQPEVEYTGFLPNSGVYEISSVQQLGLFAELVNSGITSINGKLTANIVLNKNVLNEDGSLSKNYATFTQWSPIGTSENPFKGTFDGQGHTISGLYFNNESKDSVGLFGVVDVLGKVMNVGIENSYIKGGNYVGGVAGKNSGTISKVYNTGSVSGTKLVGGVVGYNSSGSVSNVFNAGSVNGSFSVGGVVGYNDEGSISKVYNTGSVSGRGDVGGVVGYKNSGTISNAYYNKNVLCDNCSNSVGTGKTSAELASTTLPSGFSSDIWNIGSGDPVVNNGKLVYELVYLKGVGSKPEAEYTGFLPNNGVYKIGTIQQLKWFAELVNSGDVSINGKLTADIVLNKNVLNEDGSLSKDYATFTQWSPIGSSETPFTGTFDGQGYTISGLYFNNESKDYVGLFGYVGSNGKVVNVGVKDSYIKGWHGVGGVVGDNWGTISNVHNAGSVSGTGYTIGGVVGGNSGNISDVSNKGFVSGMNQGIGGVVGDNSGTISNAYNAGSVSGNDDVGGVVGYNSSGSVSNVYNIGAVNGSSHVGGVVGYNYSGSVSNVYNTGSVSGTEYVGGVVGYNYFGSVSNVYNTGSVSGTEYVGGAVGGDFLHGISNAYYNMNMPCTNCSDSYGTGKTTWELATTTLSELFTPTDNWVAGSVKSDLGDGRVVVLLPGLRKIGPRPEMECDGMKPNSDGVYEISSAQELEWFAVIVNDIDATASAKLTANIVLNKNVLNADGSLSEDSTSFTQWTPIGTTKNPFTGSFDGNGYKISGLYFNNESKDSVGLFGVVGSSGKVMNVGVEDSYIKGRNYVGGVAGGNYKGSVSNVYNTGSVSGNYYVGGVVGYNSSGSVSNVYNTGSVSGNYYVGGVVGYNSGTVGIVYSTGSVSGSGFSTVGGVVGRNVGSVSYAYYNTDFFTGNALGSGSSGENVKGLMTVDLASTTLPAGFSSEIWVAGTGKSIVSDGKVMFQLPGLKNVGSLPEVVVLQPEDGVYAINTAQKLKWFAKFVNEVDASFSAKLTADIVLNDGKTVLDSAGALYNDGIGLESWTPMGTSENPFTGSFNGNNHTISGLYFNDADKNYVGLFGYVGEGAVVQKVGVKDSYFKGNNYVGGVVGINYKGTVNKVYNTSSVNGAKLVGGVVGYNGGSVNIVYNTGSVSGTELVGGVAGLNVVNISDVYNTGSVTGSDEVGGVVGGNEDVVGNAYSTGSVTGSDEVGGVAGYDAARISNSYFNTEFYSGNAIGSGNAGTNVLGKTTAELASATLPKGFSSEIWLAGSGKPVADASRKKLVLKLPGLKNVGKQPEIDYILDLPNDEGAYVISSAQDLIDFAELVNGGVYSTNGVLAADIVLNKNVLKADGSLSDDSASFTQWTPIGTSKNPFKGTFDGNGYTISGLYFNNDRKDSVGLFGYVSVGSVRNVGLEDSYIKGRDAVGGIAGSVGGGGVNNVYNKGSVNGNTRVGGIAGIANAPITSATDHGYVITDAYNAGLVNGTDFVGGVVGFVGGSMPPNNDVKTNKAIGDGVTEFPIYAVSSVYNMGTVTTPMVVGGAQTSRTFAGAVVGTAARNFSVTLKVGINNETIVFKVNPSVINAYYKSDEACVNCRNAFGEGMTQSKLTSGKLPKGFSSEVWTAGSVDSVDDHHSYKFPYLTMFDENSQPQYSPAIVIAADNKSATVYGSATDAVNIDEDIEITGTISLKREFPKTAAAASFSSLMLPFESNGMPDGISFYSFAKVSKIDGKWTVSVREVKDGVKANTPYLVKVNADANTGSLNFDGGTFKVTAGEHLTTEGNWNLVGTYEYKKWQEGDPGLGYDYGFAGSKDNDPSIVGKFVKIGVGAYIYPMRAYLEYKVPAQPGRPAAPGEKAQSVKASLPESMDVMVIEKSENGEETTRVIGSFNTRTGEFKPAAERYYDMKGRYLGKKRPNVKGVYNNGKKVFVR